MSSSNLIASNNKIYDIYLPNPYPYPAQANSLAQVLIAGDDAGNNDAVNFNTLESTNVETTLIHNPLLGGSLSVGSAGETIRVLGATAKGSLLVGDGTDTKELVVGANGLVLKANTLAPYGVEWAVDQAGGAGVATVSAGTNISVTGTAANPIVNLATPTTSDIQIGVGTQIIAKDNYATPNFAMSIDSTGLNDEYTNGAVLNKEDIAISAVDAVQTISATNGTTTTTAITTASHTAMDMTLTATNAVTSGTAAFDCDVTKAQEQLQFNDLTAFIQYTQTQKVENGVGCTLQAISEQLIGSGVNQLGTFAGSSSVTQGEVSSSYQNLTSGALYTATGGIICNTGGSSMTITSQNLTTAQSHLLRMECPASGDALIEHTSIPGNAKNLQISTTANLSMTADNIDLSTAGRLILPSLATNDRLDYNPTAGNLTLRTDNTGYATDNLLFLNNVNPTAGNTTGVPSVEFYKSGRNAALNDVIMSQQFNALDFTGTKRTYGKIECSVTGASVGTGNDGALDFYSCVNGANNIVFRMNGADNENNCFRPLDMTTNNIINIGSLAIGSLTNFGTAGQVVVSRGTGLATQWGSTSATPGIGNYTSGASINDTTPTFFASQNLQPITFVLVASNRYKVDFNMSIEGPNDVLFAFGRLNHQSVDYVGEVYGDPLIGGNPVVSIQGTRGTSHYHTISFSDYFTIPSGSINPSQFIQFDIGLYCQNGTKTINNAKVSATITGTYA